MTIFIIFFLTIPVLSSAKSGNLTNWLCTKSARSLGSFRVVSRCQKCSHSYGKGMSLLIKYTKTPGMGEKDMVGMKLIP